VLLAMAQEGRIPRIAERCFAWLPAQVRPGCSVRLNQGLCGVRRKFQPGCKAGHQTRHAR